jgi:2-keto-4-pentenoate hydratase
VPQSRSDLVLDAFASRRLIGLLSDSDPTLDLDGAYAIAKEVHERRLARGENPLGRKIGFTNYTIWPKYGIRNPIWGHIYDSTVKFAAGGAARLAIGHMVQPRIEPEIQLHFTRIPPVTRDEGEILDCIDWIALGFELVQCPFENWQLEAVDAIAACAVHGALMIGTPVPVAEIKDCAAKLRSFTVTLSRGGKPRASGGGAHVLDTPLLAFAHLAEVLACQPQFSPVQGGEVVTTGTLTDLLPVEAGETWTATPEGIELPSISITLT